jgi:hypothetical protein
MIEKKFLGHSSVRQKSFSAKRGSVDLGRLIGIVVLVIVLGLLGYGVYWIINSIGEAGGEYGQALVSTRRQALAIECQINLRSLWQNLRAYAMENEGFPPSLKAFEKWGANSRILHCPAPDGQRYAYIPGQNEDAPGNSVLVYESKAAHEGRCNMLRVDGQIELLTPGEVQAAVSKTLIGLRRKR